MLGAEPVGVASRSNSCVNSPELGGLAGAAGLGAGRGGSTGDTGGMIDCLDSGAAGNGKGGLTAPGSLAGLFPNIPVNPESAADAPVAAGRGGTGPGGTGGGWFEKLGAGGGGAAVGGVDETRGTAPGELNAGAGGTAAGAELTGGPELADGTAEPDAPMPLKRRVNSPGSGAAAGDGREGGDDADVAARGETASICAVGISTIPGDP